MKKLPDELQQMLSDLVAAQTNSHSNVLEVEDPELFVYACKKAFDAYSASRNPVINGAPFLSAIVLKIPPSVKEELGKKFKAVWDRASKPGDLLQNIELNPGSVEVPVNELQIANSADRSFLLKQVQEMHDMLRRIVGTERPLRLEVIPNNDALLTRETHQPAHPFPVLNFSYFGEGTVIQEDEEPRRDDYRVAEGDVLFMLPLAYHRPPEVRVTDDGSLEPRLSLICRSPW